MLHKEGMLVLELVYLLVVMVLVLVYLLVGMALVLVYWLVLLLVFVLDPIHILHHFLLLLCVDLPMLLNLL